MKKDLAEKQFIATDHQIKFQPMLGISGKDTFTLGIRYAGKFLSFFIYSRGKSFLEDAKLIISLKMR